MAPLTSPVGSVRAVATRGNHVILTYDDGPDPESTLEVVNALSRAEVSATFFVLMSRVHRHKDVLAEIVDHGYEVGLHGWDHTRLTEHSTQTIVRRIRDSREELQHLTGSPVRWFRPPYGAQSPRTWSALKACGLTPVMWTTSTQDSRPGDLDEKLKAALHRLQPGAIILAHDSVADESDGAQEAPTPFALDRGALATALITALTARGMRPMSLGEALELGGTLQKSAWFGGF